MAEVNLERLLTEQRNLNTKHLDDMSILEFLKIMNDEDASVAGKVNEQLPQIEIAVQHCIQAIRQGGRIVYIGSGTSGRLGVLDAVECPPTFSTTTEVIGIIAGGDTAFVKAKEGAEDQESQGSADIEQAGIIDKDVVIGIAASGRTPHTIGALQRARQLGAYTVALSCNPNSSIGTVADLAIEVAVGPEVITGSTRLKAGTAQKLVLNMISTATMVGLGKTYQNLMVDLKPSNEKLVERSKKIIMEATECSYETACAYFEASEHKPKVAIVMLLCQCDKQEAIKRLAHHDGFIKKAMEK